MQLEETELNIWSALCNCLHTKHLNLSYRKIILPFQEPTHQLLLLSSLSFYVYWKVCKTSIDYLERYNTCTLLGSCLTIQERCKAYSPFNYKLYSFEYLQSFLGAQFCNVNQTDCLKLKDSISKGLCFFINLIILFDIHAGNRNNNIVCKLHCIFTCYSIIHLRNQDYLKTIICLNNRLMVMNSVELKIQKKMTNFVMSLWFFNEFYIHFVYVCLPLYVKKLN